VAYAGQCSALALSESTDFLYPQSDWHSQRVQPSLTLCCPQARLLMAKHSKPQIIKQLLVLVKELSSYGATPPPE